MTQTPSEFLNKKKEMRDFIFKKFCTNWNQQILKSDFSKFNIDEQRKLRNEIKDKEVKNYNSELELFLKSLRDESIELKKEIYKAKFPEYSRSSSSLNIPGLTEMNSALLFTANLPAKWSDFVRSAFDMGRVTFAMQTIELILSSIPNTYGDENLKLFNEANELKTEFENALGITDKLIMMNGLDELIKETLQFVKDTNDLPELITWDIFNTKELEILNSVHPALYSQLRAGKFTEYAHA